MTDCSVVIVLVLVSLTKKRFLATMLSGKFFPSDHQASDNC